MSRGGSTWWGQAWLDALEHRAVHEPRALGRGRSLAKRLTSDDLQFEPNLVRGWVPGPRSDPYEASVFVRDFRPDEWECVFDAVTQQAGFAAALLDGELAPGIVAAVEGMEVDLLPRSGDLRATCSCPDGDDLCKHAAAVCHVVASALDQDPFLLLLLRGRTRDEVIDEIRTRWAGGSVGDDAVSVATVGVVAAEAWARTPGPLPDVPPIGDHPGRPAALPSNPPDDAPVDAEGFRLLAADAAHRAWAVRAGIGTMALGLGRDDDLARRAAAAEPPERRELAFRAGTSRSRFDALAAAWEWGGTAGRRALDEEPWSAPAVELASAKAAIEEWGVPEREIAVRNNRLTVHGERQYRRARDGRWYRFVKHGTSWALDAPPADDIVDLIED